MHTRSAFAVTLALLATSAALSLRIKVARRCGKSVADTAIPFAK